MMAIFSSIGYTDFSEWFSKKKQTKTRYNDTIEKDYEIENKNQQQQKTTHFSEIHYLLQKLF